jgi:hypothetical protein
VSVPRCRFAARSGRLPLPCLLGLALAIFAVLLLPPCAVAFLSGGDDGAVCQAPQPPGDPLTVVAFLTVSHGCLLGGPVLLTSACGRAMLPCGEPTPRGLAWTVALVGRPPPHGA